MKLFVNYFRANIYDNFIKQLIFLIVSNLCQFPILIYERTKYNFAR